jgi:hypothetical protein
MIGAKELLQIDQAATFHNWKAQGLSACDGTPKRIFRGCLSLGLLQD